MSRNEYDANKWLAATTRPIPAPSKSLRLVTVLKAIAVVAALLAAYHFWG